MPQFNPSKLYTFEEVKLLLGVSDSLILSEALNVNEDELIKGSTLNQLLVHFQARKGKLDLTKDSEDDSKPRISKKFEKRVRETERQRRLANQVRAPKGGFGHAGKFYRGGQVLPPDAARAYEQEVKEDLAKARRRAQQRSLEEFRKLATVENAHRIRLKQKAAADIASGRKSGIRKTYSFTTAKGSMYEMFSSGQTIRNKAPRSDVGHEGDFGPKPISNKTYFVSADAAGGLGTPRGKWKIIDHGDGTLSVATPTPDGKGWGISPGSRNIPVSSVPQEGMVPIELWTPSQILGKKAYGDVHFGNKITKISQIPNYDLIGDPRLDPRKGRSMTPSERSALMAGLPASDMSSVEARLAARDRQALKGGKGLKPGGELAEELKDNEYRIKKAEQQQQAEDRLKEIDRKAWKKHFRQKELAREEEIEQRKREVYNKSDPLQRMLGKLTGNFEEWGERLVGQDKDAQENLLNHLKDFAKTPTWMGGRKVAGAIAGGDSVWSSGATGLVSAQLARLLGGPRALGHFAGGMAGGVMGAGIGRAFGNAALGRTLGAAAGGLFGGPLIGAAAGATVNTFANARQNNIARMESMGNFSPQVVQAQAERRILELDLQQRRAGILGGRSADLERSFQAFDSSKSTLSNELGRFWQNTVQPVVEVFLAFARVVMEAAAFVMDKFNDILELPAELIESILMGLVRILDPIIPGNLTKAMQDYYDRENRQGALTAMPDIAGLLLGHKADRALNPVPAGAAPNGVANNPALGAMVEAAVVPGQGLHWLDFAVPALAPLRHFDEWF